MSIPIQDYEVKQPVLIADNVKIDVESVELHRTARVRITFMKENNYLSSEIINLTQEEYDGWNADDTYIENLVLEKYGIKKI